MKKNKKIDNSEIGSKEFPLQNNDSSVKSTVRPSADKINFLNENMKDDGNYGSREYLREKWGLNDSDTNVDHKKRLKFIRVIVAFLVTILILVSVFYILPRVLPKFFEGMISNSLRKMTGEHMRFCPPGHWSLPKSIGQFSIPILTFFSSAARGIRTRLSETPTAYTDMTVRQDQR